jgi:hypothetical protein
VTNALLLLITLAAIILALALMFAHLYDDK